jgi:toxin FitB
MTDVVLLDSGPLGIISHPKPTMAAVDWLTQLLAAGIRVLVPEIADFEVRRELLRARRHKGIKRLDRMKTELGYLPITTAAILQAAEFWADARRRGHPTSHDHALDGDVILAGQGATLSASFVVATGNPRHLSRFVPAKLWHEITP